MGAMEADTANELKQEGKVSTSGIGRVRLD